MDRTLLAIGRKAPAAVAFADPAQHGLPEAIAELRCYARGNLSGDHTPGRIAARLAAARYAVAVYDAGEVGEVGVEMLHGLAVDVSERGRCFTLSLSERDQDRAVIPVAAWTTGQPPRCGFGRRLPEHDPWRFGAARQVAAGEADAILWLASMPTPCPGWLADVPSVALVTRAEAGIADVVIAVGRPGRDTGGVLWDEGRGALVYRPASAPSDLPSAAAVLGALTKRLAIPCARRPRASAC